MASLDSKKALVWLDMLYSLDRLVGKQDYHWYNIEPDEYEPPLSDEDFHMMFEFCAYHIMKSGEIKEHYALWWERTGR